METFKQEEERFEQWMAEQRCPMSDAEIDRTVHRAVWSAREDEPEGQATDSRGPRWPMVRWAAAAAIVVAMVATAVGLLMPSSSDVPRVTLDGQRFYFMCNRGCSADVTVKMLNNIIQ